MGEDDIAKLLIGLVLAAGGGIAFVAYNHRQLYLRVVWRGVFAFVAAWLFIWVWNIATALAFGSVRGLIPAERMAAARDALDAVSIPAIYLHITWGFVCYLGLAGWVSKWVHKGAGENEKE